MKNSLMHTMLRTGCALAVVFGLLSSAAAQAPKKDTKVKPQLIKEFFADQIEETGYLYAFPEKKTTIMVNPKNPAEVQMSFMRGTYSGCAIGNYPASDLSDVRYSGYLEFYVKGAKGGEPLHVYLVDCQDNDGVKCQTELTFQYFKIRPTWQKVSIPLSLFSNYGSFWDGKAMQPAQFDWTEVLEILFITPPGDETAPSFDMKKDKDGNYRVKVKDVRVISAPRHQMKAIANMKYKTEDVIRTDEAPVSGCYHCVFRQDMPPATERLTNYEELVGKKVAGSVFYRDFSKPFPADDCTTVAEAGAVPMITWEPWLWDKSQKFTLSDLIAGDFDEYITKWAEGAKAWGKPVFVRFAHEFNGNWYPWSMTGNGQNGEMYIGAWRHVVDIFKKVGAANVQWIWTPYWEAIPNQPWNDCMSAYPGDDYVDWVGMSLYNFGSSRPGAKWREFDEMAAPLYFKFVRSFPTKPIIIPELGCSEDGGDKDKWIENMDKALTTKFPRIFALAWFDILKETDWRVDSSIGSLVAFQAVIRKPHYKTSAENMADMPKWLEKNNDSFPVSN